MNKSTSTAWIIPAREHILKQTGMVTLTRALFVLTGTKLSVITQLAMLKAYKEAQADYGLSISHDYNFMQPVSQHTKEFLRIPDSVNMYMDLAAQNLKAGSPELFTEFIARAMAKGYNIIAVEFEM